MSAPNPHASSTLAWDEAEFQAQLADVERFATARESADHAARTAVRWNGSNHRAMSQIEVVARTLKANPPGGYPSKSSDTIDGLAWWESIQSNRVEGSELPYTWLFWAVVEGDERILIEPKDQAIACDVDHLRMAIRTNLQQATPMKNVEAYLSTMREAHGNMMVHRPQVPPGRWKDVENRIRGPFPGTDWIFPPPQQVESSLRNAWRVAQTVPPGEARARLLEFATVAIHPFRDGNGRMSRWIANAERTATQYQRMIVHPQLWAEYLRGLQLIRTTNDASTWLAAIDAMLGATHAHAWTYSQYEHNSAQDDGSWATLPYDPATPERRKHRIGRHKEYDAWHKRTQAGNANHAD